jgi:hypothetical protein
MKTWKVYRTKEDYDIDLFLAVEGKDLQEAMENYRSMMRTGWVYACEPVEI